MEKTRLGFITYTIAPVGYGYKIVFMIDELLDEAFSVLSYDHTLKNQYLVPESHFTVASA